MARRKKTTAKKAAPKTTPKVEKTQETMTGEDQSPAVEETKPKVEETVKEETEESKESQTSSETPEESKKEPLDETPAVELTIQKGRDIIEILSDKDLSPDEKINEIRENNVMPWVSTINMLDRYIDTLSLKKRINPVDGAGGQYSLLVALKAILKTEDYKEFAIKWTIVNLYAQMKKDEEFSMMAGYRFAPQWSYGEESIQLFQNLMDIVIRLNDPGKRVENLKKIDLNRVVSKNLKGISENAKENLMRYYGINS